MKYELTAYDIALIAGGFTILGALISTIFGYWFAKLLASHTERRNAYARLRAAFVPTLVRLASDRAKKIFADDPAIDRFLLENLEEHALAVERFRPFVKPRDAGDFQQAFERYRQRANDGLLVSSAGNRGDPWKIMEESIHDILRFGDT